jgi:hypothetical protein
MPDREFLVASNPAGGSIATIRTGGQNWRVTQVSNDVAGASGLAYLKRNGAQVTPMIASNGVAGGEPPVDLYPADVLTVEWATAGLKGRVRIQYQIMRNFDA